MSLLECRTSCLFNIFYSVASLFFAFNFLSSLSLFRCGGNLFICKNKLFIPSYKYYTTLSYNYTNLTWFLVVDTESSCFYLANTGNLIIPFVVAVRGNFSALNSVGARTARASGAYFLWACPHGYSNSTALRLGYGVGDFSPPTVGWILERMYGAKGVSPLHFFNPAIAGSSLRLPLTSFNFF